MSQDKKIPRPISAQSLRNKALRYIDRFATSTENLRTVLMRHVRTSAHYHNTSIEDGQIWVDELLVKLNDAGFLNDRRYAEGRAGALHRKGTSSRLIRMKLKEKGISEKDINFALEALREEENTSNLERKAALTLAKKRRLGPWRDAEKRDAFKEKDMATLARAGFSYDLAQTIINAEDVDSLSDLYDDI